MVRYHLIFVRKIIMKRKDMHWRGFWRNRTFIYFSWESKLVYMYGKRYRFPSKFKMVLLCGPVILLLCIYQNEITISKAIWAFVIIVALFIKHSRYGANLFHQWINGWVNTYIYSYVYMKIYIYLQWNNINSNNFHPWE